MQFQDRWKEGAGTRSDSKNQADWCSGWLQGQTHIRELIRKSGNWIGGSVAHVDVEAPKIASAQVTPVWPADAAFSIAKSNGLPGIAGHEIEL
jgi:hypothetical protein